MKISLANQRALVTGSSSGIGQAIAVALGKAGAKVAVNYRSNAEGAEHTRRQIEDAGSEAIVIRADVSDPAAVRSMFCKVDEAWGGIDIVINNAGIDGRRATTWEIDPEAWTRVIGVNLYGAFYAAREGLRRMLPQGTGVLLSITSVHETIPWAGYSAYTAAKAAVSMMTKSLALEIGDRGVRVLCLAPGAIKTAINKDVWSDGEQLADLHSKIPMGRMGTVDEIAGMVAVLVSDAGSYISGTTLFVDGAMTAYPSFAHGG